MQHYYKQIIRSGTQDVFLAFLYAEIEVNMDQIEDMINKLIDIEEELFLHYSEIPDSFEDDLAAIETMSEPEDNSVW